MLEPVSGRVTSPLHDSKLTLYAYNRGKWWIQPFRSHPEITLNSDGTWTSATHLGSKYAAVLSSNSFRPPSIMDTLPPISADVKAVANVIAPNGKPEPRSLRFSGYDWLLRSSTHSRAGELCEYEPANVSVDGKGRLHLLMGSSDERWRCAGLYLPRSLGYGTYRFVVEDSSHLPPAAVLALFTRADSQETEDRAELDIELSRWGKPQKFNADFVVQPYYVPANNFHFNVPPGPVTITLRWEPGVATFQTESLAGQTRSKVQEHVFRSGIPVPSNESVNIDFYDFHHDRGGSTHPLEIIIDRFEYLP